MAPAGLVAVEEGRQTAVRHNGADVSDGSVIS
jgi:hypothetical protein